LVFPFAGTFHYCRPGPSSRWNLRRRGRHRVCNLDARTRGVLGSSSGGQGGRGGVRYRGSALRKAKGPVPRAAVMMINHGAGPHDHRKGLSLGARTRCVWSGVAMIGPCRCSRLLGFQGPTTRLGHGAGGGEHRRWFPQGPYGVVAPSHVRASLAGVPDRHTAGPGLRCGAGMLARRSGGTAWLAVRLAGWREKFLRKEPRRVTKRSTWSTVRTPTVWYIWVW